jgi:hypothetical protein
VIYPKLQKSSSHFSSKSPGFLLSPKLTHELEPQQLQLRDAVQGADAKAVAQIFATAAVPTDSKLWAGTMDEQGFTLLMEAVVLEKKATRRLEICTLLLEKGANASAIDEDGYSALHWAAACDGAVLVPLLVKAGAACDVKCSEGESPLHRAARMGHAATIKELVLAGASVGIRNADAATPIDVAGDFDSYVTKKHRVAVRQLLLSHEPRLRTLILHHADCLEHITDDTCASRAAASPRTPPPPRPTSSPPAAASASPGLSARAWHQAPGGARAHPRHPG